MIANEVAPRIEELISQIAEKEAELARKVNRCSELSARPTANTQAKRSFMTRCKTEIKQITDELNNLKTELWGLQEINLPGV